MKILEKGKINDFVEMFKKMFLLSLLMKKKKGVKRALKKSDSKRKILVVLLGILFVVALVILGGFIFRDKVLLSAPEPGTEGWGDCDGSGSKICNDGLFCLQRDNACCHRPGCVCYDDNPNGRFSVGVGLWEDGSLTEWLNEIPNSNSYTDVCVKDRYHSVDLNQDYRIVLSELVEFYSTDLFDLTEWSLNDLISGISNGGWEYHCSSSSIGYSPGIGDTSCEHLDVDFDGDWKIETNEINRLISLTNYEYYYPCSGDDSLLDGFCNGGSELPLLSGSQFYCRFKVGGCEEGEGNCENNNGCKEELICAKEVNGTQYNASYGESVNVCILSDECESDDFIECGGDFEAIKDELLSELGGFEEIVSYHYPSSTNGRIHLFGELNNSLKFYIYNPNDETWHNQTNLMDGAQGRLSGNFTPSLGFYYPSSEENSYGNIMLFGNIGEEVGLYILDIDSGSWDNQTDELGFGAGKLGLPNQLPLDGEYDEGEREVILRYVGLSYHRNLTESNFSEFEEDSPFECIENLDCLANESCVRYYCVFNSSLVISLDCTQDIIDYCDDGSDVISFRCLTNGSLQATGLTCLDVECTEHQFEECSDGSTIMVKECIGGEYFDTGNICNDSGGMVWWIVMIVMGVLVLLMILAVIIYVITAGKKTVGSNKVDRSLPQIKSKTPSLEK